jgi:hypothetical protein
MNPLPVLRKLDEVVRVAELKKLQEAMDQANIALRPISTQPSAKRQRA